MSDWKVIADNIEVFPHPNADKMELGRIGSFQVVVGKGLYKSGDLVVFAPKRSILPPDLRPYFVNTDTGKSYLKGPNEDRVGSIRLRGEESEGAILPWEWVKKKYGSYLPADQDLSALLGIEEYIPEIHSVNARGRKSQDGDVVQRVDEVVKMDRFVRHDVEQFRIFQNEFKLGEPVVVTEKIHGTQINILKDKYGRIAVTSKGRAEKNLVLRRIPKESLWKGRNLWKKLVNFFKVFFCMYTPDVNEYWRYAESAGIIKFLMDPVWDNVEIQVIGEVVPVQNGYSYGYSKPEVLVFRVVIGTKDASYGVFQNSLNWVPLLYRGPYDPEKIIPLSKGEETVSGKGLHIREGVVLTPEEFRKTDKSVPLLCKIINPAYKEENDDLR